MKDMVSLSIGGSYVVEPDNPRKTKNRGRNCTILAFELVDDELEVRVVFHDTNREASLKVSDLKAITE
ncbi:hypothetical protein ACFPES_18340 [Paenibacillus sp. GCM10023248]|uniref:hypothetical protein n=1 Tax=Bacillales TaxID=1385 RepID=UPI0023780268|nr:MULTISPECIES: hypothetical protein [Bacillales]MDD9269006.1 hypothetical protein [Paenibacillus sp. MAHUQ-63]MDR6884994.1 hypothetical protein [Bacillus sp. 3255]